MRLFLIVCSLAVLMLLATADALAVDCGGVPTDARFHAVCGLQRRDIEVDENWAVEASGVFVRWTDAANAVRHGIVTARHFLDQSTEQHGVPIQFDSWYAYFYLPGCASWPQDENCLPLCMGANENMIRVRVKSFMLPVEEFYQPIGGGNFGGPPGPVIKDGVVVGEIEPADLAILLQCFIAPVEIVASPFDLGVCREQSIYVAGWGNNCGAPARNLHIAASTLTLVTCGLDGRNGGILFPGPMCGETTCVPGIANHDSGGGILVETQGGSLALIGTFYRPTTAFMSMGHQYFSDPESSEYLCAPCKPRGCVDITSVRNPGVPDGNEDEADRDALAALGAFAVNCRCMGDLNGNGCAGDADDLAMMAAMKFDFSCASNRGCYGDGQVDQADLDLIGAILAGNNNQPADCPTCSACPLPGEWCQGDINCDGSVSAADFGALSNLLSAHGPFTCLWNAPGCTSTGACP